VAVIRVLVLIKINLLKSNTYNDDDYDDDNNNNNYYNNKCIIIKYSAILKRIK